MSEVEQFEQHIKNLKTVVAKRDQAIKLSKNKDFKEIILEGFCVKDAAKYIQQAGDPNMDQKARDDALAIALSAGHLKRYLSVLVAMGNRAEDEMQKAEMDLEEVRAEEDSREGN